MARIVFASAAYLGDVAPFVEPANRLAERGHDVAFLAPAGFHDVLGRERFDVLPYPLDFSSNAMHRDPVHERLMRHPFANSHRLARYWMRKGFVDDPAAGRASMLEHFDGADVVVSHPTFGSAVVPAARHVGARVVVGQLFPMMMPTARWSPPLPNRTTQLGRLNRASWTAFARGSGLLMYDRQLNANRRELGMAPMVGVPLLGWTDADRTVVLVSRHYFGEEPDDWPDWPLVGFSHWRGPAGDTIDPRLDAFVAAGDAPVLVCLGTSAAAGAGRTFDRIASDLDERGVRSVLLVGDRQNLAAVAWHPGAFTFAPVHELLGRCRAAVVSGALGTLAAALAAGVPVVVLPQLFDQIWHGVRVEQLGVGLLVQRPSQVAKAVAAIGADPSYARRAAELAARLADEDGAAALVEAVESVR